MSCSSYLNRLVVLPRHKLQFNSCAKSFYILQKEEKRKAIVAKETSKLQDLILRTSKQISDLESDKKILDLQKQSELKRAELLGAYEARDEKRLSEKKKLLYNLDMEIEKCKTRLERTTGTGGTDKTEIDKKQKTIEDLERSLNDKIATSKLLQGQIANLEVMNSFKCLFIVERILK